MNDIFNIRWDEVWAAGHLLELVVRGSLMYLALFVMLRVILKRQSGAMGITDMLLIVLIADAAQNGMAADYRSVTDGVVLVGTIILWSYALDWLGYKVPWFQRLISPEPLPLVRDGRILRRNLGQEALTEEELMSQLRLQGIDNVSQVKKAFMEGDGRISVVKYEPEVRGAEKKPVG